jgi:hypothetical protein
MESVSIPYKSPMVEEFSHRRYRFQNGAISSRPLLNSSELGLTKAESDLSEYLKGMSSYIERLAGDHSVSNKADCVFCSFDIESKGRAYSTSAGKESFVATEDQHNKLWDEEIVLTFNPDGWHLVNEIIFPRDHIGNKDLLESDLSYILETAFNQWKRHAGGLKKTPVSESDYYHGSVMNLRSGQSVTHGHLHCYTSTHELREFDDQGTSLFSVEINSWKIFIKAIPFDHPRLEFTIPKVPANKSYSIAEVGSLLGMAASRTYEAFTDMTPPMSLGWFFDPSMDSYSVLVHPMQRRGTVQVFQSTLLHKFNEEQVADTFRPELKEKLLELSKGASITYE